MRARILLLLITAAGCTRTYYRESADRETYPIVQERVVSPAFAIGRTRVEPASGSRLADPFDPDHPPKPPDDVAAALFMERPGGLRGSHRWEQDGQTGIVEGPGWLEALGREPDGTLKLDPEKAVDVALLNSREYQTALENVYLAALALTLNRFEFDIRWFGRNATTFTHDRLLGGPSGLNTLTGNTDIGFNRDLAAGGQLMADFANALVFEYSNGSSQVRSNLIFTFTQPLLRTAGRQVRLETLTQAERNVLYAVRDFARFRKQFWAGTAIQGQGGAYLDLLLAVQTVRNARANLRLQEESYRLTDELFRGGRASAVEFDQAYRGLLGGRQAVINAEVGLQSALDAYKLRLGLPPRLQVELDDALLNQFVLTDPAAERLREDLEAFQRERLKELDDVPTAASLTVSFTALKKMMDQVPAVLASATADLRRWEARLKEPSSPKTEAEQTSRARAAYADLSRSLPTVSADLTKLSATLDKHQALVSEATRKSSWEVLTQDVKAVLAAVDTITAIQTQTRIYLIELPDVKTVEAEALAYAKRNRLDLMNALGGVTDAWRKVTVAANALRSDLDIVATADLGTDRDHDRPLNYAAEASRYTVGVRLDGPLNRQAERNTYRASLITYQRAKRSYIALSDQIEFQIRNDLRQLNRLRLSFEIARQSVISAARQYENARLKLLGPRNRQAGGGTGDPTTLELQQALQALLDNRNALAAALINYEQQRVQLLLDLEELQLDPRGFPTNVGQPLRIADTTDPSEPDHRLTTPPPVSNPDSPPQP